MIFFSIYQQCFASSSWAALVTLYKATNRLKRENPKSLAILASSPLSTLCCNYFFVANKVELELFFRHHSYRAEKLPVSPGMYKLTHTHTPAVVPGTTLQDGVYIINCGAAGGL